jgi:hypothetical protein
MHRFGPDANAPRLRLRAPSQKATSRGQAIVSHFVRSAVNVNGDDPPFVSRLYLAPDLALIDFAAKPGMFLFAVTRIRGDHRFLPSGRPVGCSSDYRTA